jgi:hypothetical protein
MRQSKRYVAMWNASRSRCVRAPATSPVKTSSAILVFVVFAWVDWVRGSSQCRVRRGDLATASMKQSFDHFAANNGFEPLADRFGWARVHTTQCGGTKKIWSPLAADRTRLPVPLEEESDLMSARLCPARKPQRRPPLVGLRPGSFRGLRLAGRAKGRVLHVHQCLTKFT